VPAQAFFSGYPARAHADSMRQLGALTRLPDLLKKVQALEARLKILEGK
jgi:UDP-3-O-[3-hydroxymyristoyl] glucosamine N-acyltransferase